MNNQWILALSRGVIALLMDSMVRGMVVLLLAGGAICLLARAHATTRHRLWLFAIVLTALMPLLILMPGWRVLPASAGAEMRDEGPVALDSEVGDIEPSPVRHAAASAPREAPSASPRQPIGQALIEIAAIVWALGAAAMGGRLLLARVTLWRLARRAKPASDTLANLAHELKRGRKVRILQSNSATLMPMTWGLLLPTVLLPAGADQWPASRQRVVLLHELFHTQRFDYAWICLAELIAAVYWFNPLWRWAVNQLRDEAEQACDESVLAAGEDRCAYADELLATVKGYVRHRRATALALGMSRCSTLESRLKLILSPRRATATSRRRTFVLFAAVVAVVVPLSQIRLEAQSKPASTEPAVLPATTSPSTASAEVTYGGMLQDTDGKPIPNATLMTGWAVPHRMGENPKDVKTDAQGAWSVSVDPSWTLQHILGAEPGYVRLMVSKPDRELLAARKLRVTMERAVRVTGFVRDEDGQPIVGALITPPLIWNSVIRRKGEDPARIYSGADGKFTVDGLSPTNMLLYISAEAFAPALVTPKRIDRPMIEMLSKGADVPGVVLDQNKKPLPNTAVTMTDWRYKGLHRFSRTATTDDSGRFVVRHVPREGDLSLQASGPGLLSVRYRVTARENPPYEVQIIRPAKAHVEVLDDATGKPVTSLQYSVSEPASGSDVIRFSDFLHTTIESKDAKFDVVPKTRNIYSADQPFRIRVSADNYMPQDSPVFHVSSESSFTIRLKPAKYISGSVLNADGSLAANAQVAWIRPERHMFVNVDGVLDTQYVDIPDSIVKTDAAGHFSDLKVTSESGNIGAMTPNGYAVLSTDAFNAGRKLTLKPWASLEGKFMQINKSVPGQRLLLQANEPSSPFWSEMTVLTGIDGSYSFHCVPASAAKFKYGYKGETNTETIDLKSGQTTRHDVFRND